jgi:hypothetical protein
MHYDLPILNQQDRNNINRPTTSSKIEAVIKNHPKKECSGLNGFKPDISPDLQKRTAMLYKPIP